MTIQPPPPKPRRRIKPLTVLITLVIVLICLVVAADRIGERIAEDQVGARLQTKLETPEKPRVEIERIPFLTQVIAGRFGEVRITADQVPVSARGARADLDRLDLALREVAVTDQQLNAGAVDGTAFVDYASLSSLGGAEVNYVADGKIAIDFTTPVGGQTVSGTLAGRPVLTDGQLGLVEPQLRVAGIDLPQTLVDALLTSLLRSFTLPDLPFNLALTSVTASDSGMTFGLAGRDIAVDR
jgi:hypothetical protein